MENRLCRSWLFLCTSCAADMRHPRSGPVGQPRVRRGVPDSRVASQRVLDRRRAVLDGGRGKQPLHDPRQTRLGCGTEAAEAVPCGGGMAPHRQLSRRGPAAAGIGAAGFLSPRCSRLWGPGPCEHYCLVTEQAGRTTHTGSGANLPPPDPSAGQRMTLNLWHWRGPHSAPALLGTWPVLQRHGHLHSI